MAPTDADVMFPYLVVYSAAFWPTKLSMARRSLRSIRRRPLSSAILKTMFRTPVWVSFRSMRRPSMSGPMREIVLRMGWPCSPNTSKKRTGQLWN